MERPTAPPSAISATAEAEEARYPLEEAAALALAVSQAFPYEGGGREVIRVYADRTLQKPLEEIVESFLEERCGNCRVAWVWGSSGYALSRLSIDGKGDLYVADDSFFAYKGVEEGILDPGSLEVVGYLKLALLVREGNPKNIAGLVDALKRLDVVVAVGNPEHVSAGVLAWRVFKEAGLDELVEELAREGRVRYAPSAGDAASWVVMGLADAAVTFDIYAKLQPDQLDSVDDPLLSSVKSPVVVALPSSRGPLAQDLYNYVLSHRQVFWEYGVEPVDG